MYDEGGDADCEIEAAQAVRQLQGFAAHHDLWGAPGHCLKDFEVL
jgi:hypothetical protein